MVDSLTLFFGAKKKGRKAAKKSPGRKPKRAVKSLPKSQAYITVGGRRRKLYRGKKGGLFYRTKSGRHYVPASVLRRKQHMLSPKRGRKARKSPARKGRKSRFGMAPGGLMQQSGGYNSGVAKALYDARYGSARGFGELGSGPMGGYAWGDVGSAQLAQNIAAAQAGRAGRATKALSAQKLAMAGYGGTTGMSAAQIKALGAAPAQQDLSGLFTLGKYGRAPSVLPPSFRVFG